MFTLQSHSIAGERPSCFCALFQEFRRRPTPTDRPAAVVKMFLRQLDLGKVRDVVAMLPDWLVSSVGAATLESIFFDNTEELRAKGGIFRLEVKEERVEGQTAEVDISLCYRDGTSDLEHIVLVKEQKQWKVDMTK